MNQLQFQLARNTDPESSWRAADAIEPSLEDQCNRVLRFLVLHPHCTCGELADLYAKHYGGTAAEYDRMFGRRLDTLRKKGKAISSADRQEYRRCRYGKRLCQTWRAA